MLDRPSRPEEVQEALHEFQQYLSDALAPMMAAGAIEVLIGQPVALVLRRIQGWTEAQYQGVGARVPVSDYLFHALKKIHMIGEFDLVPADAIGAWLSELQPVVVEACPEEDRPFLVQNLARLGTVPAVLSSPTTTLYRQPAGGGSRDGDNPLATRTAIPASRGGPPPPPHAPAGPVDFDAAISSTEELARGLSRFNRLIERLESRPPPAPMAASMDGGPPPPHPGERSSGFTPALVTAAASGSASSRELEELLGRLAAAGIDTRPESLIRSLTRSLPEWGVAATPNMEDTVALRLGGAVGALGRFVTLAPDAAEGARRFREMVMTAVEQVNEGSLARAVPMLELAERLVARQKIEKSVSVAVRAEAQQLLDMERIRAFAEKPEKRILLKAVLGFFPALQPRGLLPALEGEPKRDARRLLLLLLEVHGLASREAALDKLSDLMQGGTADWWVARNLLHVLRRVPRPDNVSPEGEIGYLDRLSTPGQAAALVKEALSNLAQIRHVSAEKVLLARAVQFETLRQAEAPPGYSREELDSILDRAHGALARLATPATLRAVVEHGLKRDPKQGDTTPRLVALSQQDLSGEPELVEALLRGLRAELPAKLLARVLPQESPRAVNLILAMSGTSTAAVRSLLEETARRHPDREFGRAAAKALGGLEPSRKPAETPVSPSLVGDLEVFGLPTLLQTLEQMLATGVLAIRNQRNEVVSTLAMEAGKIRRVRAGRLNGIDALFQIFERPFPGTFTFVRAAELRPEDAAAPAEAVMPLLLEGMRRYDELQRAIALVPDDAILRTTEKKPSLPAGESDPAVAHAVWSRAAGGATALACEAASLVDAFRSRRLLAHWVEEGALLVLTSA